jgi:hypothetical protein
VRKIGLLLVVANVLWMAACGGGGDNNNSSSISSVTVACSPTTVNSGGTSQCVASVTGTGNFSSGVAWTTSAGSISNMGLLTAPVVSTTLLITVTATSVQDVTKLGQASVTVNPTTTSSNIAPLVVDAGPTGNSANIAFTTVTVCVPGTNQCQEIDHVLVDTGSSGLRLLSSVLTVPLPQSTASDGNPLDECLIFLDGYVWGPVATADVIVGGESAASVPVHVTIPSSSSPAVPDSCSGQTTGSNEGGSVGALGANGILGVSVFQQDCGLYCTNANQQIPDWYYECPSSGCIPTYTTLAQQVPNPVSLFPTDNNGVLIQLPAVPNGGSPTVSGSLIFGIGTQSNNGLGSANIYQVPDSNSGTNNLGTIITTFNGHSYDLSFIDSGSNGIFFLDANTTGIPTCQDVSDWYCPSNSPVNLTATNQGQNDNGPSGDPITVNFTIENADSLFQTSNSAWSTLGGPFAGPPLEFDWGLPFYYGKNVFTAIEGASTPGGTGPYIAY